jgi:hypothetical protein
MNSTREPSVPDSIPPVNRPDSYQSKSPRRPISLLHKKKAARQGRQSNN